LLALGFGAGRVSWKPVTSMVLLERVALCGSVLESEPVLIASRGCFRLGLSPVALPVVDASLGLGVLVVAGELVTAGVLAGFFVLVCLARFGVACLADLGFTLVCDVGAILTAGPFVGR